MKKPMKSELVGKVNMRTHQYYFIFRGDDVLLRQESGNTSFPTHSTIQNIDLPFEHHCAFDNEQSFAAKINKDTEVTLPENLLFFPIRQCHTMPDGEKLYLTISKARQTLHWDQVTQHCGQCGEETQLSQTEQAKQCNDCESTTYTPIAPVILALVYKDNEILLGRSYYFLPKVYSILAGFVEPGETIENAVKREVKEEVGVDVDHLEYYGSQPWPFPSSIMLGFFAKYTGGDLKVDNGELEDAQWFPIKDLPKLPSETSLSRLMIDDFVKRHQ